MISTHSTPLSKVVSQYEHNQKSKFRPTLDFYHQMGISHIRFGKLIKGTAIITGPEARVLASFFKVEIADLI